MIRLNRPTDQSPQVAHQKGRDFTPYPDNGICARLGDKWTVLVIWQLSRAPTGRLRFSALKNGLDGITQRMLTLTLRNLERDGLVLRHYFPEVPPRVEYELTDMGAGIIKALEGVNVWVRDNLADVEKSRRAYDGRT
ncbi:transcriptional regulator [Rhizobiales bacterium RZME27]|jgi:DNA-binding HxlR family transcriptional regulator|uniref:Transcriptional regulator n=1 Tax=Endobacterium cereale TaxID=2663029 RepID=A0A6A8A8J6_9HYPH|nr:transcriptional regulator [Endobacterium cereale]